MAFNYKQSSPHRLRVALALSYLFALTDPFKFWIGAGEVDNALCYYGVHSAMTTDSSELCGPSNVGFLSKA